MIFEIEKNYLRKQYNGKIYEAIKANDGILWTDNRIKNAFNFGNGTKSDLQKYIENNQKYCYFVEV